MLLKTNIYVVSNTVGLKNNSDFNIYQKIKVMILATIHREFDNLQETFAHWPTSRGLNNATKKEKVINSN